MIDRFDCEYFRYSDDGMYCELGYKDCSSDCYKSRLVLSDEDKKVKIAFSLYTTVLTLREKLEENILLLGYTLKTIRDNKLYEYLNCDSFTEFLGSPEVSIRRSTAYSFIKIYELFSQKLNVNPETIKKIGHGKLKIIEPVVERDPEKWLQSAVSLSRSDLKKLVAEELNKPELPPAKEEVSNRLDIPSNYLEYVENHGCIFHPERKADKAHFPKTRAAGAPADWVIPLCRECHQHYHDLGVVSFFEAYRDKVIGYFYETINLLFGKLKEKKDGH